MTVRDWLLRFGLVRTLLAAAALGLIVIVAERIDFFLTENGWRARAVHKKGRPKPPVLVQADPTSRSELPTTIRRSGAAANQTAAQRWPTRHRPSAYAGHHRAERRRETA